MIKQMQVWLLYWCGISTALLIRVHQNSKKFSKSHGILIYFVLVCMKAISAKKMIFLQFSQLGCPFLIRCFLAVSEFDYFSSKSGKHMKQVSNPSFWGDVGVKKWSPFFYSAARSPIFGHLKIGTFGIFRCPKMGLQAAESKNGTTFSRQHPPKMVDLTLVSCVYHFWMRNKQILNFAYFYLIFP